MDLPYLLHLQRKLHIPRSTFPLGHLPSDLLHHILSFLTPLPPFSRPTPTSTSPSLPLLLSLRPLHRALLPPLTSLLLRLFPTLHLHLTSPSLPSLPSLSHSPHPLPSLTLSLGLVLPPSYPVITSSLPHLSHLTSLHLIRCLPPLLLLLLPLLPHLPVLSSLTLDRTPLLPLLSSPLLLHPSHFPPLPSLTSLSLGLLHPPPPTLSPLLSLTPTLTSLTLFSCQRPGSLHPPLPSPLHPLPPLPHLSRVLLRGFALRVGCVGGVQRMVGGLGWVGVEGCVLTPGFVEGWGELEWDGQDGGGQGGGGVWGVSWRGSEVRPPAGKATAGMLVHAMRGMKGLREVDLRGVEGPETRMLPQCQRVQWTASDGSEVDERRTPA